MSVRPYIRPSITLGRIVDLGSSELNETLYTYSLDDYKHFSFFDLWPLRSLEAKKRKFLIAYDVAPLYWWRRLKHTVLILSLSPSLIIPLSLSLYPSPTLSDSWSINNAFNANFFSLSNSPCLLYWWRRLQHTVLILSLSPSLFIPLPFSLYLSPSPISLISEV